MPDTDNKMSDDEFLAILRSQMSDSVNASGSTFKTENKRLLDSYLRVPYGNEEEGRSQVISADHYDLVESDITSLAEVFLSSGDALKFKPLGVNDAKEAEQKTAYANYLIKDQPNSFEVVHGWMKEAGCAKCSVVKFFVEDTAAAQYVNYEGLSEAETALIMQNLQDEKGVERVDVINESEEENGFKVKFRVTRAKKKICIKGVPVDNFILSEGANCLEEAQIVGDESLKSKGDLIAAGFKESDIRAIPPSQLDSIGTAGHKENKTNGGFDSSSGYHWANELVLVKTLYALVDYDGDGIPERRYIILIGSEDKVFKNEPFEIVPYATLSQVLTPHSVIGASRGEPVSLVQKEKTAIKRAVMDNIYEVSRPRTAIDDSAGSINGGKVDLDEFLDHRIQGVVRVDGNPYEAIMPLTVPYIGGEALQTIQYIDNEKAQSVGQLLANQGLATDDFYNETAARFNGVDTAAKKKIKHVARVYSETGFKRLYNGVIWLAQHFQDEDTEIMVLGEPLIVSPSGWEHEHHATSHVGLGAGDSDEAIANIGALLSLQMSLIEKGSTVADWEKIYNTSSDMVKAMGKPDASRYFNDPSKPEQTLQAENAQMQQIIQQMQEQLNNPLVDAEKMRAEGRIIELQMQQKHDMEQFIAEARMKTDKELAAIQQKYTEMELKYKVDIPNEGMEQSQ